MTPTPEELRALAERLARDLMRLGDDATPCHRIEFKGGSWPESETAQGGMREDALARFFAERIACHLADVSALDQLAAQQESLGLPTTADISYPDTLDKVIERCAAGSWDSTVVKEAEKYMRRLKAQQENYSALMQSERIVPVAQQESAEPVAWVEEHEMTDIDHEAAKDWAEFNSFKFPLGDTANLARCYLDLYDKNDELLEECNALKFQLAERDERIRQLCSGVADMERMADSWKERAASWERDAKTLADELAAARAVPANYRDSSTLIKADEVIAPEDFGIPKYHSAAAKEYMLYMTRHLRRDLMTMIAAAPKVPE